MTAAGAPWCYLLLALLAARVPHLMLLLSMCYCFFYWGLWMVYCWLLLSCQTATILLISSQSRPDAVLLLVLMGSSVGLLVSIVATVMRCWRVLECCWCAISTGHNFFNEIDVLCCSSCWGCWFPVHYFAVLYVLMSIFKWVASGESGCTDAAVLLRWSDSRVLLLWAAAVYDLTICWEVSWVLWFVCWFELL